MAGAPTFTVRNRTHAATTISTVGPVVGGSLEWAYRLAQHGGPGDIRWTVALSDPALAADDFAPLRTDWQLVMNGSTVLAAGIVTGVQTGSEDGSGGFGVVRCAGLDWLAWLDQPWPFAYETIAANQAANQLTTHDRLWRVWTAAASGAVPGVTYSADQQDVAQALVQALAGYEGAPVLSPSFGGTGWTLPVEQEIAFGDTDSLLDLLVALASMGDPYGFDLWVEPDKTVRLVAPRRVAAATATATFTLNNSNVILPPLDWTNNGPRATDTVVTGTGKTNTRTVGFSKYQASRDTYRRWVRVTEASFPGQVEVASIAAATGYQDRFPHKDLKVRIRPDLLDPGDPTFGFTNMLGKACAVDYTVAPYHHIDALFWITEQQYSSPDGGNWVCDLTLSQIYGAAATPD